MDWSVIREEFDRFGNGQDDENDEDDPVFTANLNLEKLGVGNVKSEIFKKMLEDWKLEASKFTNVKLCKNFDEKLKESFRNFSKEEGKKIFHTS